MTMQYQVYRFESAFTDAFYDDLAMLASRVLGNTSVDYLRWRLEKMPDVSLFLAHADDRLVGFKAGYAATQTRYYSWLGGVDPDTRRVGIASRLMEEQHAWLNSTNYELVETHVLQDNLGMIQLNLNYGFKITGMFLKRGQPNYIMQKALHA